MTRGVLDLYPLAENAKDRVRAATGYPLSDLTLQAVVSGDVEPNDLTIAPETLQLQADIARAAGRPRLAENFERAAELARIPEAILLDTYELLRPGRATSADQMRDRAVLLRTKYQAMLIANMINEAAEVYEERGLFTRRY